MSVSAISPHAVVFRDERMSHGPRAVLWAANTNEPDAIAQTSPYRAVGLYQGRGLAWPAWTAALALHGALALIAVALGWTSMPPVPLPETIAVVFEHAPAPAAEPAPPEAQPPASTARAAPEASSVEQPPVPAHPAALPVPAPAAVAVVRMPMPPPARPRPEPSVAQAPAAVEPAAPTTTSAAPPQVAAVPTSLAALPVIPPHPISGMAGNRKPAYPVLARSRHLEGRVMLQVDVTAAGDPLTVRVISSSGHDMLDGAAVDAVRTWRFVPATRAGQAVAGSVDVPVDFRMVD
jgi:periplasmic protein TonB